MSLFIYIFKAASLPKIDENYLDYICLFIIISS